MDHRVGIFSIPDFAESRQFPAFKEFFSPQSNPSQTGDVGKTNYPQHRADHQLQPPLSGMSVRLEVIHKAYRNASGKAF